MNKRIKKKKEKKRISAIKLKKAKLTSAEALLKKQLKTFSEQIKVKSVREQRRKFIEEQITALENKDRSRRRGANKNKWTEVDLQKYAKLQEELKQIDPFSYASKRGMNLQFDEDSNVKEVGAMIQKYYDYVDKGIIKPRQFIDNYDQANYMASIMTVPEIQDAIKQADIWKERGLANQLKRQEETLKLFENFNF